MFTPPTGTNTMQFLPVALPACVSVRLDTGIADSVLNLAV